MRFAVQLLRQRGLLCRHAHAAWGLNGLPVRVFCQSSKPPDPSPQLAHSSSSSGPSSLRNAATQKIGSTLHFAEQQYESFEAVLMTRINESNRRRFRTYFFGSLGTIVVISVLFGEKIRKAFTDKTAGLAKETLENESLKIQTQELATAVVQTILNDKEITAHAATFLKEASTTAETQAALLELTMHVLQHPKTLDEAALLAKKLLNSLSQDKEVLLKLSELCAELVAVPSFKAALVQLIAELCKDPDVMQSVTEMLTAVLNQPAITTQTYEVLQTASNEVLQDDEILGQSRNFVANVMGDDLLQREGGTALWKSVLYALQPGVIRVTGACLVCISIAAIRVFLSPY